MDDDTTTVAQLRGLIADFVAQREWEKYHDAKNLSMAIAIEAAELMEHFQWVRSDELQGWLDEPGCRAEVSEELADVLCFALALANALEIDLAGVVESKLRKNAAKYPVEQFRGRYYKPGRGPSAEG